MTRDEILALANKYAEIGRSEKLEGMPAKMMEFDLDTKHHEKLNRWLGFMQGVLWSRGAFTLNELRHHNKYGFGRAREG